MIHLVLSIDLRGTELAIFPNERWPNSTWTRASFKTVSPILAYFLRLYFSAYRKWELTRKIYFTFADDLPRGLDFPLCFLSESLLWPSPPL